MNPNGTINQKIAEITKELDEPEFLLHVKYFNTMLEWNELISALDGESLLAPFDNS